MPPTDDEKKHTFLEDFIVCLASRLIGSEQLISKLGHCSPFSLYWRSRSSMKDPPAALQSMKKVGDNPSRQNDPLERHPLLFLDITFCFDVKSRSMDIGENKNSSNKKKGCRPSVSIVFGAFLLSRPKCTYIQSAPMTIQQLESHVSIDLYSAPADEMASLMTKALDLGAPPESIAMLPSSSDNRIVSDGILSKTVQLDLDYTDIHETGKLKLDISKSTSEFDELGMDLYCKSLFSDYSPKVKGEKQETGVEGTSSKLKESFSQWRRSFEQTISAKDASPGKAPENNPTDPRLKSNGSPKNVARRPVQQTHGYVQLNAKRRKKGKRNLYGKP